MKYVSLSKVRIKELLYLWNKELGESFPVEERLLQQNIFQDNNLCKEGSWMALDDATDQVVGFVVAKVWSDSEQSIDLPRNQGWIQVLLVDTDYRNLNIGSTLLEKAEQALQKRGVQSVFLGNDFHWRFFPGVPEGNLNVNKWFLKKGYEYKETFHDLMKEYKDITDIGLPEFEGVTFRMLQHYEELKLLSFMKRCFPGRWEYQTIQYFQRGGTGREFVVLEKEGNIIGFCRINDFESPILTQGIYWSALFSAKLGGVGPLGIDESYRGKKYGLAIVEAGIYFLLQRAVRAIVIDTTPYTGFYGKLGYKVWKSYNLLEKKLALAES